jgi:molybdopterin converting factor subunit 1
MRQVQVRYFAALREQAGVSEEQLETTAATPAELYEELRARHGMQLPAAMLRVAVNEEFVDWSRPLESGDRVVFIPPVAGG